MSSLRSHLTYANVLSTLAFFIAVSTGGAYAANTIGSADVINDSLLSEDVKNGEVKNADIGGNQVTTTKIKAGNVGTTDIADASITGPKIVPDSIGFGEIGTDAVGSSEIASGIIGADELEQVHEHYGTSTNITDSTAHDGSYTLGSQTVSCGVGEDLLSVSVDWTAGGGHNERNTIGVSAIDRSADDTATVEVNYDGGATTATFVPVATCIF